MLSLDIGLQTIISGEIQKQIDRFEAIGGAGVLLEIQSGEVLAAASLLILILINSAEPAPMPDSTGYKGLYEMGSTLKVLNTAIALETGAADINQRFELANQCGFRALPSPITNRATDR